MSCFAPECNHKFHSSGCKFMRFPTEIKERKQWIKDVRRLDKEPNESSRICSCHFVDGKRENGPTIFFWNSKTTLAPVKKRPKRKKPKKKQNITSSPSHSNNHNIVSPYVSDNDDIPIHTNVEEENTALRNQIRNLRKKIEEIKKQPFGTHRIETNSKLFSYYTGLSKQTFDMVLDSCTKSELRYFCGWKVDNLDLRDQLLITLMKLRLNLEYQDLAVRFNTTEDTVNNIVLTFINTLHQILYVNKMTKLASREENPNCKLIVGYPEFDTVIPLQTSEEEKPIKKHKNTLKGLVATDPNGIFTHCSMLYSETTADKLITKRSGITNRFKDANLVFIDEHPAEDDESLVDEYKAHVRAIERMRDFGVLTFIPKPLFTHSSKVFQLCAALTNISNVQLKRIQEMINADVKEEEVNICDDDLVTYVKTEFEEVNCDADPDPMNCNEFVTISCKSEIVTEVEYEEEEEIVMEFDIEV